MKTLIKNETTYFKSRQAAYSIAKANKLWDPEWDYEVKQNKAGFWYIMVLENGEELGTL